MLEMFRPTTDVEVKEIIIKSPNKSCDLDPMPTWLLKKCIDQLLSLITAIVNRSMDESVMPLCLKWATISPLLNISCLDKGDMKNYRPISNLPFISKLIEKVVARGREEHLEHSDLNDIYQSVYRRGHSTETAQWHCWGSWWRIHDCINYAWFICRFRRNRSPNYTEAF